MTIRVLLADDHVLMREGLRSLLTASDEFEIVGEAENGRAAVELAAKRKPHVVVMDIAMRELNGIEATRRILSNDPGVKVLALSMHRERRYVAEMLKAGASGFLLKSNAFEELARAIRTVRANGVFLCPDVAGMVRDGFVQGMSAPAAEKTPSLTPREREVLQLVAEGKSTKQIAGHLNVSVKTVEMHRQHIMGKLQLHNIAELTRYAILEGLTPLQF